MSDETSQSNPEDTEETKFRMSRRTFMWIGGLGGLGALTFRRLGCYPQTEFDGDVLATWEAHTLAAAAEVLIPDQPGRWPDEGPSPMEVADHVDAYLRGMPRSMLREIRGMFALIEHGTLLNWRIRRFTRLSAESRLDVLLGLRDGAETFGMAFEGLRALCYVGWYQADSTWRALGYDGPLLDRAPPESVPTPHDAGPYAKYIAQRGTVPRGTM